MTFGILLLVTGKLINTKYLKNVPLWVIARGKKTHTPNNLILALAGNG